ncbi:uncharacterized protein LOC109833751 [Asparagus officinalis]|uniref:uncharacterized protein LOC109833751 n=1 Tax=Asparagus officinalis TaxID=4686 RepID=UPI00098E0DE0|nr:uncharacterized protein LOC109833751 [Asparagus officinalis]
MSLPGRAHSRSSQVSNHSLQYAIATGYKGNSPAAYRFAKEWQDQNELARSCLNKASKKMKKWADKKRRHMEYQVGDLVLVKLSTLDQHKGLHKSLIRKYEGPFPIEKRVWNVAYRVKLPPTVKYHPVFHVSMLKPYHQDMEDPDRGKSSRAPIGIRMEFDKEAEEILADRTVREANNHPRLILADRTVREANNHPRLEYFVKWKSLPDSENSWEPTRSLWQFEYLIEKFRQEKTKR